MLYKQLLFFLFIIPTCLLAGNGHLYVSGQIGQSRSAVTNNSPQIFYYDGFLVDAYPLNSDKKSGAVIGLNGGYEFQVQEKFPTVSIGLGIYGLPKEYEYNGNVMETPLGDPRFMLYNYKFRIQNLRLMAEIQLSWIVCNIIPYLSFGVGPSWNRASGYKETTVDSIGYVALAPFQSRTTTALAYQFALGIGYQFNFPNCCSHELHERIALGFRRADLGQISFGTRGVDYPYHLDFGRLKADEVYFSYTHLF